MTFNAAVLLAALSLWFLVLWRRGFFGPSAPPIDRKVYWSRIAIWFASMLIVVGPLRQVRDELGTFLYLTLALAILGLCYWLGLVVARFLVRRDETAGKNLPRRDGA